MKKINRKNMADFQQAKFIFKKYRMVYYIGIKLKIIKGQN